MSKLFKGHAPKPAGPAAGPARAPRGKAAPREKLDQAATTKAEPKTSGEGAKTEEIGGSEGPEPTRYGDWEIKGRCVDF